MSHFVVEKHGFKRVFRTLIARESLSICKLIISSKFIQSLQFFIFQCFFASIVRTKFYSNIFMNCRLIENEQYSRRENLIISGIPENVSQDVLEPKVLQILETISLSITSYEIAACHRLKKHKSSFPAHAIVRFTNRKAVEFCLTNRERLIRNKQKLKMNLRFYENLRESNETTIR